MNVIQFPNDNAKFITYLEALSAKARIGEILTSIVITVEKDEDGPKVRLYWQNSDDLSEYDLLALIGALEHVKLRVSDELEV